MLSVVGEESTEPDESAAAMRKNAMLATSAAETESVASDEMLDMTTGGPTGLFTSSDPASRKVVPENVGNRTVFKVIGFHKLMPRKRLFCILVGSTLQVSSSEAPCFESKIGLRCFARVQRMHLEALEVVYVVLESQYQSSLTVACKRINASQQNVAVECSRQKRHKLKVPHQTHGDIKWYPSNTQER